MYSSDHENYLKELDQEHRAQFPHRYQTTHTGDMAVHSDGVKRDTQSGKTLYTLMFPKGVPMDEQLIVRVAELYTRGGARYGNRNWEDSSSEDTLEHHTEALWRHFMKFFFDVQDGEDHAAAIVWNINSVEMARRNIEADIQASSAEEFEAFERGKAHGSE